MTPILDVAGYTLEYRTRAGRVARARRRIAAHRAGRGAGAGRRIRLRQDHAAPGRSCAHLPRNARELGGTITLDGAGSARARSRAPVATIRGRRIGMVFQDPADLAQSDTDARAPGDGGAAGAIAACAGRRGAGAAIEALRTCRAARTRGADGALSARGVGRREAARGDRHRLRLPARTLIIFDEPTTALDVITGARILDLFAPAARRDGRGGALHLARSRTGLARRRPCRGDPIAAVSSSRHAGRRRLPRSPAPRYTRRLVAAVPRPERRLVDGRAVGAERCWRLDGISVTYARPRLFGRPAEANRERCQP